MPPAAKAPAPTVDQATKIATLADMARALRGKKAFHAWQEVLLLDAWHSEALFNLAALSMGSKQAQDALTRLGLLAKRMRLDAIEFLIEARRHPAFAPVRGDAAFRELVGIGALPATDYERLMAHGGGWEQTGTACDRAEVVMQLARARTFTLLVTTRCQGEVAKLKFRGTWSLDAAATGALLLTFGKAKGTAKPEKDQATCSIAPKGDEFMLTCAIDEDLQLEMLPSRRSPAS